MKLLEAGMYILHSSACITARDRKCSFVAACNRKVRSQGMSFGVRPQPVHMLFGSLDIVNPNEHSGCPGQSEAE